MSSFKQQQVSNVKRRTWDIEAYEQRAKQRAAANSKQENSTVDDNNNNAKHDEVLPEEFRHAPIDRAGPEVSIGKKVAFLQARSSTKEDILDSKVGTSQLLAGDNVRKISNGVTPTAAGWHCKVCDCVLKDSHTYLDHINGRKHQRKLGYSMRVERSTREDVASRLANVVVKQQQQQQEQNGGLTDIYKLIEQKDTAEQQRKEERSRKRKERKQERKMQFMTSQKDVEEEDDSDKPNSENSNGHGSDPTTNNNDSAMRSISETTKDEHNVVDDRNNNSNDDDDDNEEEEEVAHIDPALAAMMGFSGFGGSSKQR